MKESCQGSGFDDSRSVSSQEAADGHGDDMAEHDRITPDNAQDHDTMIAPAEVLSKLLQDKEQEWAAVTQKKEEKGPLQLLDLPMDVLKEIVREVRTFFPCSDEISNLS